MADQGKPLVTFIIPCYNSADFMQRAVDSVASTVEASGHACEVILINDGSKDDTGAVARRCAERYECVTAIDQENTNWGGVINHGLSIARGSYFKVLDSDDYFDEHALLRVLDMLALAVEADKEPDLLVTNYVYDHLPSGTQRIMQYRKFFPQGRLFEWGEMGKQGRDKFIMIHAAWYKTAILRESNVKLPEGISYTDGLLLLHPMTYVKTLYYLDIEPYHYIIGREGQSVEIDVVKKHIDEQLLVTRLAIDDADYTQLFEDEPHRATLMAGYVSCMMSVSTLHLSMINTPDSLQKNRELWAYLKEKNPKLYGNVKWSLAGLANRRTRLARLGAYGAYLLAKKIYKFA